MIEHKNGAGVLQSYQGYSNYFYTAHSEQSMEQLVAMPQTADQPGGQFLIQVQSPAEPQGLRGLQASTGNGHDCVRAV